MNKCVRLLLVWLMLLAIPFQGIASAAMLTCAHATMPGASAAVTVTVTATGADGHCHEAAPQAAPLVQADHSSHPDHGDHAQGGHDHDGRCSACAACCMGAALAPAPSLAAAPPVAPQSPLAGAAIAPAAVDLALPERPPRPSLA